MERLTKVPRPSAPPAARPYIYNVPPTAAPIIQVGHRFSHPTLAISLPRWLVSPVRRLGLRVLE